MTSETEARRVRWGYEANTPRCCNCRQYQKARMPKPDKIDPARCRTGGFTVEPNGCCDKWTSRRGEKLK